ncbi:hypothetical protein ABHI18_002229, partial [Aspergillus niger]
PAIIQRGRDADLLTIHGRTLGGAESLSNSGPDFAAEDPGPFLLLESLSSV